MRKPGESWSDYYRRIRNEVDAAEAQRPADAQRVAFLDRLYNCKLIVVTEWETHFIHDLVTERRDLSPAQRDCIDGLRDKYEARLNQISPDNAATLHPKPQGSPLTPDGVATVNRPGRSQRAVSPENSNS